MKPSSALCTTPRRRRERGVVLVISLLLLLVLTLIGLAATRSTTIEQRLTANQHDSAVALQGAEAALRDGESLLNSAGLPNFALNTGGAFTESTMDASTSAWDVIDWSDTSTATVQYEAGIGAADEQPVYKPRYYIVLTDHTVSSAGSSLSADAPETSKLVYYVYAHSYGLTADTSVYLESVYAR